MATTRHRRKRRAAIYCRISLDGSGLEAGVDRQELDCTAFCKAQDIDVVEVLIDNDVGASRYSRKRRPGWERAMTLLEEGTIDTIVGWHEDRLYRRPAELEVLIDMADRGEVYLHTPNGERDLANSDHRFVARINASVSAKASDDASRRLKDQKRHRRAQGMFPSGECYGWRAGGVIVAQEANVIHEMVARVIEGESLYTIAADLTQRGVPTRRNGSKWTPNAIRRTLRAPRHAGLVSHDDEILSTGNWTPLIERKTWDRVQRILNGRGDRHRYPRRAGLLAGLVHCSHCGTPLVRSGKPAYLLCKRGADRINGCGGLGILAADVEAVVEGWVLAKADTRALLREIKRQESKTPADGGRGAALAELERTLAEMETDLAALRLPYQDFMRASALVRAERDRLVAEEAAAVAMDTRGALSPYLTRPGYLRKAWEADELGVDQKREVVAMVLRFLGRQVVIEPRAEGLSNFDRVTFAEVSAT